MTRFMISTLFNSKPKNKKFFLFYIQRITYKVNWPYVAKIKKQQLIMSTLACLETSREFSLTNGFDNQIPKERNDKYQLLYSISDNMFFVIFYISRLCHISNYERSD